MNSANLKKLLEQVRNGSMDPDTALGRLRRLPFEDLGYARVDLHRSLRTGFGEVVYCEGKTPDQVQGIVQTLTRDHVNILATRASRGVFEAVQAAETDCCYHTMARIVVVKPRPVPGVGRIAVVSAGTSDLPVAEEAAVTAEVLGSRVVRIYDVGVAGIHRLIDVSDDLLSANVAVVVAGMEGALASVVGGLVACPVIGLPTSVGYGASFNGLAALLSMLNSCAAGVSVVNIDNGFGAGYQANLINRAVAQGAQNDGSQKAAQHPRD